MRCAPAEMPPRNRLDDAYGFTVLKGTASLAKQVSSFGWRALVEEAHAAAEMLPAGGSKKRPLMTLKDSVRSINAGVKETHLNGPKGEPLRAWMRGREGGEQWLDQMDAVLREAEGVARTALVSKFGFSHREVDGLPPFENHSVLSCYNMETLGQVPHADVLFRQGQFLMALTTDCKPTNVWPLVDDLPAALPDDEEFPPDSSFSLENLTLHTPRLRAALQPLSERSSVLLPKGAPAGGGLLQPGDMVSALGPVIHAGPPTRADEERAVLFFTIAAKGGRGYDHDIQITPWQYWHLVSTEVKGLLQCLRDYLPWDPVSYFDPSLQKELRKAVAAKSDSEATLKKLEKKMYL